MFQSLMRCTAVVALLAGLTACSTTPLTTPVRLGNEPIAERTPDASRERADAVNFFREAPVTLLESAPVEGLKLVTEGGGRVPDVTIKEVNATPMKFAALLDQVSQEAGLSWRFAGKDTELMNKDVFYVQRSETQLAVVLNELSRITDSFISMSDDRIIVNQDALFVAKVPRMENSQDVLAEGLQNVGATEIFKDKLSGTISFRATRPVYESAQRLMKSLESGRDMIVYDFWLVDRVLTDKQGTGVDLNALNPNAGVDEDSILAGGSGALLSGKDLVDSFVSSTPAGIFVSGNLGQLDIAGAVSFLRTLGDTTTISRPTISLLSGAESSFKSGEKTQYISSINATADEGVTDTGSETEELETGLEIKIGGTYNGGVISTKFDLKLSELIEWQDYKVGDETLRLPRTTDRAMQANLEARPGDVMVLGGIIRDRNSKAGTNLPGTDIYPALGRQDEKVETVVLVRPRLVQIRPTGRPVSSETTFVEGGIHDLSRTAPAATAAESEGALAAPVDAAALVEDEARARRAIEGLAE